MEREGKWRPIARSEVVTAKFDSNSMDVSNQK